MKIYNIIITAFLLSCILQALGCYDVPKPVQPTEYQWETIDQICFTQCDTEIADITGVATGQFCFGIGEEWISLPTGDTLEGHWTGNLFITSDGYQLLLDGNRAMLSIFTTKKYYQ
jgi:hypothetical protein